MKAYEGIRIADFTQVLSGPTATQTFALLGADVIKVEPVGSGDQMRTVLTDPEMAARGLSPGFLTSNLGKRSFALDLKTESGRDAANRLIDSADVVVENFRPGVAAKLGIDFETVRARKPDIVYCSISGYGQTGPKSSQKAYDTSIQADTGMMTLTGTPEIGPTRVGFMAVDMFTGMNAAFAIASALHRRQVSGEGQYVDVAMFDSALAMMGTQTADLMVRGNQPELLGNRSSAYQPTSGGFQTADGAILTATVTAQQQENTLHAVGLADMLDDPRFATREARRENLESARKLIEARIKTLGTAACVEALIAHGVPVEAVRTLEEAVASPQLDHRGIKVSAPDIAGLPDNTTLIGSPFIANADGPLQQASPPGEIGQHTDEILRELGL